MNPLDEAEIANELLAVSGNLGISIELGCEGMQLTV